MQIVSEHKTLDGLYILAIWRCIHESK